MHHKSVMHFMVYDINFFVQTKDMISPERTFFMSTIPCSEDRCAYQKEGYCYLNAVTTAKNNDSSSLCLYFCSKKAIRKENLEQNQ